VNSDATSIYQFYKKQLQILGRHYPGKHWVLKAPAHSLFLDTLMKVFPDANLIQLRRDPLEVVPSMCSLIYCLRTFVSDAFGPGYVANQWCGWLQLTAERIIESWDRLDDNHLFDMGYRKFLADPIEAVKKIYSHFAYTYTDEFETLMKRYIEENRQNKFGRHRYTLEQFDLDRADLEHRFENYSARFPDN
jgi:hypothetical protein